MSKRRITAISLIFLIFLLVAAAGGAVLVLRSPAGSGRPGGKTERTIPGWATYTSTAASSLRLQYPPGFKSAAIPTCPKTAGTECLVFYPETASTTSSALQFALNLNVHPLNEQNRDLTRNLTLLPGASVSGEKTLAGRRWLLAERKIGLAKNTPPVFEVIALTADNQHLYGLSLTAASEKILADNRAIFEQILSAFEF